MAKTQDNSTLATFRIDADKWELFKAKCSDRNSSASKVLKDFIDNYLNDSSSLSIQSPISIDSGIDKRIETLESRIDERYGDLSEMINNAIAGKLDIPLISKEVKSEIKDYLHSSMVLDLSSLCESMIKDAIASLRSEFEEKLSAISPPTPTPDTNNQLSDTTTYTQESLNALKIEDLRAICNQLGIDKAKTSKAYTKELIKLILQHQQTAHRYADKGESAPNQ